MFLAGVKKVQFVSKENGETISGYHLYLSYPVDSSKGLGLEFDKVFVSDDKYSHLSCSKKVGEPVKVYYNKYGKVDDIVDDK